MRIVFLGTGGYHPNDRRETAGVLLPELGLLLDAGTGTYRLSQYVEREDLTIVLSHAHLDHVCGLTYLLGPLHRGEIRNLRVFGTAATLEVLQTHLFAQGLFPVLPECEFLDIAHHPRIEFEEGSVLTHHPLPAHPGGTTGFRIEGAARGGTRTSMAYITDTRIDGTYTDFIRGVDLLVHECYFRDAQREWADKTGHTHTSAVARLAQEARVGRLLLTHVDPDREEDDPIDLEVARAIFERTELAEDLMTVVV